MMLFVLRLWLRMSAAMQALVNGAQQSSYRVGTLHK